VIFRSQLNWIHIIQLHVHGYISSLKPLIKGLPEKWALWGRGVFTVEVVWWSFFQQQNYKPVRKISVNRPIRCSHSLKTVRHLGSKVSSNWNATYDSSLHVLCLRLEAQTMKRQEVSMRRTLGYRKNAGKQTPNAEQRQMYS
jgi:hypothetical protein